MSSDEYIECPELSGRTIQSLRIYSGQQDGAELQILLIDGTSFSFSLRQQPALEAILYKGGVGTPEILRNYIL